MTERWKFGDPVGWIEPPDDDYPDPDDVYAAFMEPHTLPVNQWHGYGPDAEERPVEVEITPSYPKYSEAI